MTDISRRAALGLVAGGALGVAGLGTWGWTRLRDDSAAAPGTHAGHGAAGAVPDRLRQAIERVEAARHRSGRTVSATLTATRGEVDLGGRTVPAMSYNGALPGTPLRMTAGDLLEVELRNRLDQATSVHWHGLAVRNDMDGVPGLTTPEVAPGATARYRFVVPDPGTYWFHPHTGLQLDWGLYAPLVVEDPAEPGRYDDELVVVLDDWSPGLGRTPEQILTDLQAGTAATGGMGGMDMGGGGMGGMTHTHSHGSGGSGGMGGMDGMGGMGGMDMSHLGDVDYPGYLVNGRLPQAAGTFATKPGRRVRLRVVNAAADTVFDLALAGHRMTVTHSDGFPVAPVTVPVVRVAMGERYDVVVTLEDGVFPLTAAPVGKPGVPGRLLLRTGSGTVPGPELAPDPSAYRLALTDLVAVASARQPERTADRTLDLVLAGTMQPYVWTVNGTGYEEAEPLTVAEGEAARLRIRNRSMMPHPVHLHGHTFSVRTAGRPRKDTVLVPAMGALDVDLVADNPGRWMLHCHNAFHMAAGMMTRLDYTG